MSRHPPELPPAWACGYGDDQYGLFADLRVDLVKQRFRWIPPGRFWMGSPESEGGRYDHEGPQHEVTLGAGFWLADAACSQAFWLAVVGGVNPARFSDDLECPVEQVSWEVVMQRFVPTLQARLEQEAMVDLPSEAEWEYACRAGTPTPFHFLGESLSAAQANFDGNYPYGGAARGEYRRRTVPVKSSVPVKSFEPNAWGLTQMHGNVREWCRDGRRTYAEAAVEDPEGPLETGLRALRGGSWIDDARDLRAAYRCFPHAGYRYQDTGFRCVLRPRTSPSG